MRLHTTTLFASIVVMLLAFTTSTQAAVGGIVGTVVGDGNGQTDAEPGPNFGSSTLDFF